MVSLVTDKIKKGYLETTEYNCRELVEYLTSTEVGLTNHQLCNMVSLAPDFLGRDLEQIRGVITFLRTFGLSYGKITKVISSHPKLLEYDVEDNVLSKCSKSRAAIDIISKDGKEYINVAYYRQSASFEGAPLTPYKPSVV